MHIMQFLQHIRTVDFLGYLQTYVKKKFFFSERTVKYTRSSRVTFSGEEGQGVGRVSRGEQELQLSL